jgi:hypothetical protein
MMAAVALVLAATAAGQLLLGAFVTGIVVTWGTQLLDHAGYASRSTGDSIRRDR